MHGFSDRLTCGFRSQLSFPLFRSCSPLGTGGIRQFVQGQTLEETVLRPSISELKSSSRPSETIRNDLISSVGMCGGAGNAGVSNRRDLAFFLVKLGALFRCRSVKEVCCTREQRHHRNSNPEAVRVRWSWFGLSRLGLSG